MLPYPEAGRDAIVEFHVQRLGYTGDLPYLGNLEPVLDPPQDPIQLEPYA